MNQSNSNKVKEFTEGMLGHSIPSRPEKMNKDHVKFICKMVISELNEMMSTVVSSQEEIKTEMQWCLDNSDQHTFQPNLSDSEIITEQADAMVDAMYYMYDSAARRGMNLDALFNVVHEANMDKRDPDTKQFIRREDGKVLKRDGWTPSNIHDAMLIQINNGGF
jgi:predicted HAD superfamily Cof-like phosphohydrolase